MVVKGKFLHQVLMVKQEILENLVSLQALYIQVAEEEVVLIIQLLDKKHLQVQVVLAEEVKEHVIFTMLVRYYIIVVTLIQMA